MGAKQLYLLSVKENGIGSEAYEKLLPEDKALLGERGGKYFLIPSERAKFKVVFTGGVFDVLHMGHVLTLEKARALGDVLVVVVAANERVEKIKNRKPIHDADYRRAIVSFMKPVDLAILGDRDDVMKTFQRVKPDIVAFGYDQKPIELPAPCKSVHLTEVKYDEKIAKTSRIIRELGL